MLALYEITNGHVGESYVRCYAWAGSEAEAIDLAVERNGWSDRGALRASLVFKSTSPPFCTRFTDYGFDSQDR